MIDFMDYITITNIDYTNNKSANICNFANICIFLKQTNKVIIIINDIVINISRLKFC